MAGKTSDGMEREMEEKKLERKLQFAVLIDADNISSSYAATIFDELSQYGVASCRRIYGNWSKNNSWNRNILLEYSILPVQQFEYTTGKNSTDMAMVIDAMDLLYKGTVEGFCLVTSDSDFTRLAMRLREEQKYVLGMGESKSPKALARSCNKFIHLDLIGSSDPEEEKMEKSSCGEEAQAQEPADAKESDGSVTDLRQIEDTILTAVNSSEKQMVDLGEMGNILANKYPDFDVRNYGYTKLSVLIKEFKKLNVHKDGNHYVVEMAQKEIPSQKMIEEQIIQILKKRKKELENPVVYQEIRKYYPEFDYRDYGFSRFSKFLKSMKGLKVSQNNDKVQIK